MKLIHLNVESFKYFDALVDFLMVEKPDILSMAEASNGDLFGSGQLRNYITELENIFGWNSVYHPTVFRDNGDYQIGFGVAVMSRFPLTLERKMYFGKEEPTLLQNDHILFSDRQKYEKYPATWKFTMPLLATTIETEFGKLRLLTAHFHVSYDCLETLQILEEAEQIAAHVETLDATPLILTGDFNIRNESMAIKTLAEKMTQHSKEFTNTLCPSIHPYFQRMPDGIGLGIDHIFTRDVAVNSCQVRADAVVSDHLPLILEFNI